MILRFSHFQSMFSQFSPISCWLSYQATELLVDLAEDHWKSRKIWCPKSSNMFRPSRYVAGSWTQQKAMISTVINPKHTGIQKLPMLTNVPGARSHCSSRSTSKLVSQIRDPSRDEVRLTQKDLDDVTMTWRWAILGIATPRGWKSHETHRRIASF